MITRILSKEPPDLWSRALQDPQLRDLPFKVETNEHGQLVLSPHKPRHSFRQSRIVRLLLEHAREADLPAGEPTVEFAVETSKGIKVPDIVWISEERAAQIPDDAEASPIMPEIIVEVLSKSSTGAEMEEKRRLYFEREAREVWTCDPEGRITFRNVGGEMSASEMIPLFPALVA